MTTGHLGRPSHPNLTDLEHEATHATGARRGAWEISAMRGAASNPERRVSHTWLIGQRRRRKESQGGTKPTMSALRTVKAAAERKSELREVGDPEPHSHAVSNGEIARVQTPQEQATAKDVEVAAGRKCSFNDLRDDQEASLA